MGVASVSEPCSDCNSVCCCNPEPIDDNAFWKELVSQLISIVCLIERVKLGRTPTTSQLRKAGKEALCQDKGT